MVLEDGVLSSLLNDECNPQKRVTTLLLFLFHQINHHGKVIAKAIEPHATSSGSLRHSLILAFGLEKIVAFKKSGFPIFKRRIVFRAIGVEQVFR